jgi:hypothetical protein
MPQLGNAQQYGKVHSDMLCVCNEVMHGIYIWCNVDCSGDGDHAPGWYRVLCHSIAATREEVRPKWT